MNIRFYRSSDYEHLASLYKLSDQFEFDEITDSEEALKRKINRDPQSVLVAESEEKLIGSVSIIEDGRIALLFRLVADPDEENNNEIIRALTSRACEILKERNYKEVHSTAPEADNNAKNQRLQLGFGEGNPYRWFWMKLE